MVYLLFGALTIIILAQQIKIYLLKKSAREISDSFAEKLETDTNTLIDISSRDKDMLCLADNINKQLKILRREHLQYHQGNTELKNAVTNISHDIRTPLTAICGYLDLLRKTDDPEKIRRYISVISERTEMMKHLTDELFAYSVIISEKTHTETEEVYVNKLLEESIAGFYPIFSEKGIEPKINITEKRVVRNVNKDDLSRIFSNLLNNAAKYSAGDLEISLSENCEITFSNTAENLSSVQAEKLFDRFYTVESARNSTGLGLSIARNLAEGMGGTVSALYRDKRLIITIRL